MACIIMLYALPTCLVFAAIISYYQYIQTVSQMWEMWLKYTSLYLTDAVLQKWTLALGIKDQVLCMAHLYAMGNIHVKL